MRRVILAILLLATIAAISSACTVGILYAKPSFLPAGPRGAQGIPGEIGPRGPQGLKGKDGADGQDGQTISADASADQTDSNTNSKRDHTTVDGWDYTDPAYKAHCRDLYQKWQDGDPVTGERDDASQEAIQEHARLLCDQHGF